eukprot:PITA_14554
MMGVERPWNDLHHCSYFLPHLREVESSLSNSSSVSDLEAVLNPLAPAQFSIEAGRLLGSIVSTKGICVDPFKVEAIIQLPPPSSIRQLQSLQGKANFLRRFIANYAEITKGFMRLLKKGIPFLWDDFAQRSFNDLKKALTSAPLLSPPNYSRDFLLYRAAAESTIGMVLVQG